MPEQPDPKEIKLLADILALVLEDQPGQSTSALETIRRRAQASRITGGALKNLFLRLNAGNIESELERAERLEGAAQALQRDLAAARLEIAGLQSERHRLQRQLADLATAQQDAIDQTRDRRRILVAIGGLGAIVFLLAGVALATAWTGARPLPAPGVVAAVEAPRPTPAPTPPAPRPPPPQPTPSAQQSPAAAGPPARLSEEARRVIGEHVRTCWVDDGTITRPANATFDIQVQVDETGTIRTARLTGADETARNDPRFRSFAEHALHALIDPRCATLPLPLAMLGRRQTLDFHFAP
jgi:hypothetical protein